MSRAERGTYKRRPQTHVHSLQGGRDVETDSRKESLRKALDAARAGRCTRARWSPLLRPGELSFLPSLFGGHVGLGLLAQNTVSIAAWDVYADRAEVNTRDTTVDTMREGGAVATVAGGEDLPGFAFYLRVYCSTRRFLSGSILSQTSPIQAASSTSACEYCTS